jgi:flagellar biosynthetic protein FliR
MADLASALGEPWIVGVLLLATRIAALLLLTPVLYAVPVPPLARLLITLGVSCVIALPFTAQIAAEVPRTAGALVLAVLQEAAIGATLGFGVLMAFAGFALAGRLADVQIGFGVAQVFDPLTRTQLPILSSALGLFAVVFFFAVNGHHALLRGIAFSVERMPVGHGWSAAAAAEPLTRQAAVLFGLGFALAGPVVLSLLLIEFALGVISRNLPQMNMLVLGIPVKIVAGLLALSVWAMALAAPAGRLYAGIYQAWAAWLSTGGTR